MSTFLSNISFVAYVSVYARVYLPGNICFMSAVIPTVYNILNILYWNDSLLIFNKDTSLCSCLCQDNTKKYLSIRFQCLEYLRCSWDFQRAYIVRYRDSTRLPGIVCLFRHWNFGNPKTPRTVILHWYNAWIKQFSSFKILHVSFSRVLSLNFYQDCKSCLLLNITSRYTLVWIVHHYQSRKYYYSPVTFCLSGSEHVKIFSVLTPPLSP